jgi:hypothetical protein
MASQQTQVIFFLSPINNFKASTNLPTPIICNAVKFLSTDSIVIKINSGSNNNIYTIDEFNNVTVETQSGLISNINPNQITNLPGTQTFNNISVELISPSTKDNKSAYDITLILYYYFN